MNSADAGADVRPPFDKVLTRDLIKKNMPKFKRHDDLIVVQSHAWEEFKKSLPLPVRDENSPFSVDEDELASLVCQVARQRRLAVDKGVKNDDYRTPDIELILGDDSIVDHKENKITYRFDVTKCMFCFGNINEKMRMAELDCSDEIVVDLFAGIGYFTLPLLVHAKAKHLYACEWNPDAVKALQENLSINKVDPSRCTVIEGDNRSNRPTDVAQRVILGILPSCLEWMQTALECVDKNTGAILHCHDLVESKPQNQSFTSSTEDKAQSSESDSPVLLEKPSPPESSNDTSSISSIHEELPQVNDNDYNVFDLRGQALIDRIKDDVEAHDLKASLVQILPIKSYAPHVTHVVFDIKIEPKIR